ncbi:PpiC-type peptidyl-prolyl cis-trans isomerase [Moraxella macacae 0408225]|uniref:Chaperone SurA n=1 Tax=Moraxella macacae 0408225 TaxID=1230338 RepID=L2F629_9GAMM|nr:peptidylprolyl isomerase [Moraxella macacae]ELA08487.1 PpiC-type peptidyl-prolyl cis-trans isomerase [Moraxella macacae 0408225]
MKYTKKIQPTWLQVLLKALMFGTAIVLSQIATAADTATKPVENHQDLVQASKQDLNQDQAQAQAQTIDGVVAIVNDSTILNSELDQAVAQAVTQLQRQNQPIPKANELYAQVLEQMINRQVQLDFIKRQGLTVDEDRLTGVLTGIAKQNGSSSLADFQQRLDKQQPGGYQALRQKVVEDLSIQLLQQQQVARLVRISEKDVDKFLQSPEGEKLKQSQYRPFHIRVPYGNKDGENVSERQKQEALQVANRLINALQNETSNTTASLENLMQKAQQGYKLQLQGADVGYRSANELPTNIANDIINLKVGEVSKPLFTEQGIDVIKLIDKTDNIKHIIDQYQTRHILISPSENLSEAMAKQQIEALYQQLQQGADFATLASTYSSDTGSAGNSGSLGWVSEGDMVAPFEAMMKQTAAGDFSTPFQSQFGWHILKVDAKRKQDVSKTYLRNMAKEALYQLFAPQTLEEWMQELKAQSYIKIIND